jgi:hypothetical protein
MRGEAVLFLEKKNQKDFYYSGSGALTPSKPMAQSPKSFLVLFFKKELLE